MSNIEKVIGIAVLIVVLVVACIGILTLGSIVSKWKQKKINPMAKFPRNPKGGTLSLDEQRAINVGAVLSEVNRDFCDSLETSKTSAKKTIADILARDWKIRSSQDAREVLENLKDYGNRQIFGIILKDAPKVLAPEHTFDSFQQVYNQTGLSILDKSILEEYADEAALLEKHMDVLFNASSFEEVEQHKALFGDEETFVICMQIYQMLTGRCTAYVNYINNLKQTMPELRKRGFVGDRSELANLNIAAWDMGRMVNVARYCFDCGYIPESTAWKYIFLAEKKSAVCYRDWSDFGKAYVIGRAMWGGENLNQSVTMDTVQKLQKDAKSPWLLVPLK